VCVTGKRAGLSLTSPVRGSGANRLNPLLDLKLFHSRVFRSTVLISLVVGALQGGGPLVVNVYLQLAQGRSPLSAGLWQVPPAASMLIGITAATGRVRRVRPATLIAGGLLCSALATSSWSRSTAP
jgi:DHA2 family multidrug resistance protein-like MFS transporter